MSETKSKQTGTSQKEKKQSGSGRQKTSATLPTEWAQTVLSQLVEAQKTWFEIASQQNALLLETVTKVTEFRQSAPTSALSDWAKQGIEGFVEAQKRWAEIAVQQSEQILRAVQSNSDFSNLAQKSGQKDAGQNVESLVKMRGAWLDFVAQQNSQVINMMKQSLNIDESSPVAALADFAQEAVNNYVEVQKRWLDLATQLPFLGGTDNESKK